MKGEIDRLSRIVEALYNTICESVPLTSTIKTKPGLSIPLASLLGFDLVHVEENLKRLIQHIAGDPSTVVRRPVSLPMFATKASNSVPCSSSHLPIIDMAYFPFSERPEYTTQTSEPIPSTPETVYPAADWQFGQAWRL
jgi:hypothetical protein